MLVTTLTSSITIYRKNKMGVGHLVRESICHSINDKIIIIKTKKNYLKDYVDIVQLPISKPIIISFRGKIFG